MTKDEAIKLLDQLLSQINLTREGHEKVKEALEVLSRENE